MNNFIFIFILDLNSREEMLKIIIFGVFFLIIIASNNCIQLKPRDLCLKEKRKCVVSLSFVCGNKYCSKSKQHCLLFKQFSESSNKLKRYLANHVGVV